MVLRAASFVTVLLLGQTPPPAPPPPPAVHEDAYVRYELLAPDSSRFRVRFEGAVVTAGARVFVLPTDRQSLPTDVKAIDVTTGEPLAVDIIAGAVRVQLGRPVPSGGEVRLRVEFTERDRRRYSSDTGSVTFTRAPGLTRGSVVLPAGYRVTGCNVPAQILAMPDGRIMLSVQAIGPAATTLSIKAKPGLAAFTPAWPSARGAATSVSPASQASRLGERAYQDREIVYFLNDPSTNSFDLYHDYTESRPGVGNYFNVVRAGSRVSNPSAKLLDTGEALKVETLKGDEIQRRGLNVGEAVQPDTEVVVITFPPVEAGKSARLRISETYTDPSRYFVEGDEFVWDRAFGRPRNAVVLPAGWTAIASSIPAVIQEQADGRLRFDFDNGRPDEVQVLIRGGRYR
jgi:hypothetical protein